MFEELIKNLRLHADPDGKCTRDNCPYYDEESCSSVLAKEAADAIEELSKRSECPCWYGDVRICSLFGMPIAQPPESEEA